MVMKICNKKKQKKIVIKILLQREWHGTFDEILYYKSFLLPIFSTTNHTDY